jgi:hypothetical protein
MFKDEIRVLSMRVRIDAGPHNDLNFLKRKDAKRAKVRKGFCKFCVALFLVVKIDEG